MPKPASYHSKESSRSAPMRLHAQRSRSLGQDQMLAPSGVHRYRLDRSRGRSALARVVAARLLFAEFKYLTWTDENLLRQVVYEVLREDKPAAEVRGPVPSPKADLPKRHRSSSNDLSDCLCRWSRRSGAGSPLQHMASKSVANLYLTLPKVDSIILGPTLSFLRRPAISLGAGAAHQHCSLRVAQAVSFNERLDGLLVVDDSERARPVSAP